jgi:protein TonB
MLDAYERLGRPAGAETGEIRKAYARELKKIDQEQDPRGQELRWAYECAR